MLASTRPRCSRGFCVFSSPEDHRGRFRLFECNNGGTIASQLVEMMHEKNRIGLFSLASSEKTSVVVVAQQRRFFFLRFFIFVLLSHTFHTLSRLTINQPTGQRGEAPPGTGTGRSDDDDDLGRRRRSFVEPRRSGDGNGERKQQCRTLLVAVFRRFLGVDDSGRSAARCVFLFFARRRCCGTNDSAVADGAADVVVLSFE